ncbi:MAG: tetratricopeptide repeat protein, partial [Planctomycetota bacterium]
DFDAYTNRGIAKYEKKDLEVAIVDYDEVIRLNPQNANIYNNRGTVKFEKRDFEGAIVDFNEVIRLNPQYMLAYNNRGSAKNSKKDFEGAIVDFDEAIRLDPQYVEAYSNRGIAKKNKNDFEGAILDWEKALSLKMNGEIQQLLIETLRQYSREQFRKKEWQGAKTNLLKLKKYLPLNDPQQKQLDQKIQQLEKLLSSSEEKK